MKMIRTIISAAVEGVIKRFSGAGRPGEAILDREYFQHYGLTSRPKAGAEGVVLAQGNNLVMIASDDRRYRATVEEGEVCLYTDEGDKIHFKRGNEIRVTTGGKLVVKSAGTVEFTAASVSITGDLVVTGNISSTGTIMDAAGNTNHHNHP